MSESHRLERLETAEMELGATDAVQRHISRKVVEPKPVSQRKLDFVCHKRRQCTTMLIPLGTSQTTMVARDDGRGDRSILLRYALRGVSGRERPLTYDPVYPGIASTASFFLNETEPAFGSLFQIGWVCITSPFLSYVIN